MYFKIVFKVTLDTTGTLFEVVLYVTRTKLTYTRYFAILKEKKSQTYLSVVKKVTTKYLTFTTCIDILDIKQKKKYLVYLRIVLKLVLDITRQFII